MKKRILHLLVVAVSVAAGYQVIMAWRGISLCQEKPEQDILLKAIRLTPSNPVPFYRMGTLFQWDLRHIDLKEAAHYLESAIERNPVEQEYWLSLARIFLRLGKQAASEQALQRAVLVSPASYQGRWQAGNLYLQMGAPDKALPHFSYILIHYPDESNATYDLFVRAAMDPEWILDRLVPKTPASFRRYMNYLFKNGEPEWARKAWGARGSFGAKIEAMEELRFIEYLISHDDLQSAFSAWKARLMEEGRPLPQNGNSVANAGFEADKIMGGGFDWRIEPVKGVEVDFDCRVASEVKRSLRINFKGGENIDFHHVSQFLALKPHTRYSTRASIKTDRLTTKSGIKLQVVGLGNRFLASSDQLIGNNGWKEVVFSFETPADSKGGILRLRREKTERFDRFISGTVWVDNVRVIESTTQKDR
jgi:tetratricopeptide (TPR) repeat protein